MNNSTTFTMEIDVHPNLNELFCIILAIYFICIIIGGVIFNSFLICLVHKHPSLQTTDNIFIVNLAIGDLLRALTVLPFETDYLLHGHFYHEIFVCGLKEVVFMMSLPSAMVNLLLLTSSRLFMLKYPLKHKVFVTERKVAMALIGSWMYFLLVALVPLMKNPNAIKISNGICIIVFSRAYLYYQLFANFIIPLISVLIMSFMIFNIAIAGNNEKDKSTRQCKIPGLKSCRKRAPNLVVDIGRKISRISLVNVNNQRALKTVMIIVANVTFCWLTYIVIIASNILCGICQPKEMTWIACALNYTSILTNPILYGSFNASLRQYLTKIFVKPILYTKEKKLTNKDQIQKLLFLDEQIDDCKCSNV